MEKHPLHLKHPDLQKSPEVARAVAKKERLEEDRVPNDPRERIEAYMERLEKVFLNDDEKVRERNIEMLRSDIYDAFIIKRENVPESYFELQKRIARERGQPVEEIPQEMRERMIDTIVEDQKASLDNWIHYLSSNDAMYPTYFKYLVFRNITNLSQFDKEQGKFKTRTESTVAPFPDIFQEPLAQISDLYEQVGKDNKALKDPIIQADFSKKFPALYAERIQESLAAQIESKEEIKGEWVKYKHGDKGDAERLFASLQEKGTGWCTAGKSTAEAQINSGDFYVYYTYDKDNKPTQPRVAIRMERNQIAEVRGVLPGQRLDPQMGEVLDAKLSEFGPEADTFKKRSADMKRLTVIEQVTEKEGVLSAQDLRFLYEMDDEIKGFGYQRDPRIRKIQSKRNLTKDMRTLYSASIPEDEKSEKTDSDFVLWLAKEKQDAMLSRILPEIGDLTEKCALDLIENNRTSLVASHLEKFKTPDGFLSETIALKLIESSHGEVVGKALERLEDPLSFAIAKLDNPIFARSLIENLIHYQRIENEKLLAGLIAAGFGPEIVKNIHSDQPIRGFTEDIFVKLVDDDCLSIKEVETVRERGRERQQDKYYKLSLKFFDRLGDAAAHKLMDTNNVETLADNLANFQNLSKETLLKLLEKRDIIIWSKDDNSKSDERAAAYGKNIIAHLNSFKDLDNEVAQHLMTLEIKETYLTSPYSGGVRYKSLASSVADNLEKFHGVDPMEVYNALLKNGQLNSVIENIDKFPNVDEQALVDSRINKEKFYGDRILSDNLKKFNRIDREKLANDLIEKKAAWMVTENLEYFSHLEPNTLAETLMETGQFGAIVRVLEKFSDLNREALALNIVEKGGQNDFGEFIKNIDKFGDINYEKVFQELISRLKRDPEKTTYFLQYFDERNKNKFEKLNLSPETKKALRLTR